MKFTYKWLLQFLETDLSPSDVAIELTKLGLEVESITDRSNDLSGFKVALIEEATQHPNADKLRVCKVFDGKDVIQVVCGAPNARAGIKVVLAPVGTIIPNGNFAIKASEIRGEKSNGMLCSTDELLVKGDFNPDGIIELENDAEPGSAILKYIGADDVTFEVSVTPNRGDWLGVYGIARDLAAKKLGKLKNLEFEEYKTFGVPTVKTSVETQYCKFLSITEIKNIQNIKSPKWLQNLLLNIDIEPKTAVVDITNYFSISFARPLHAYDRDKIKNDLTIKEIKNDSKLLALNGKEYIIEKGESVISSGENIVCLGGIIGSENSKCDESTKNIILESASFDKVLLSKAARKHNIISDSRSRFERGIDDSQTEFFNKMATSLILSICAGEASEIERSGSIIAQKREMEYRTDILKNRIGLDLPENQQDYILESLGFEIISKDSLTKNYKLKIPSWRHDIGCSEVIAEEIARITGFENIENSKVPHGTDFARIITNEQKRADFLRRKAASLGFHEVVTYSFMNDNVAANFDEIIDDLKLVNPITSDFNYMRQTIIPNLIEAASKNFKRSASEISIFEIGPVFKGTMPEDEKQILAGIRAGLSEEKSHLNNQRLVDFYDVKSDVENLLEECGIDPSKLQIDRNAPKYYHPGRSASFKLGKTIIAYVGEIHPRIKEIFDIKNNICGFEIFLSDLPQARSKFGRKSKIVLSQYQAVTRDFAFVIDSDQMVGNITKIISSVDNLIRSVDIFDIYQGTNLGDGKKSVAIAVTIQSDERTLSESEINEISDKIIKQAREKFNAELRS